VTKEKPDDAKSKTGVPASAEVRRSPEGAASSQTTDSPQKTQGQADPSEIERQVQQPTANGAADDPGDDPKNWPPIKNEDKKAEGSEKNGADGGANQQKPNWYRRFGAAWSTMSPPEQVKAICEAIVFVLGFAGFVLLILQFRQTDKQLQLTRESNDFRGADVGVQLEGRYS
jgi:hypothetical protein